MQPGKCKHWSFSNTELFSRLFISEWRTFSCLFYWNGAARIAVKHWQPIHPFKPWI